MPVEAVDLLTHWFGPMQTLVLPPLPPPPPPQPFCRFGRLGSCSAAIVGLPSPRAAPDDPEAAAPESRSLPASRASHAMEAVLSPPFPPAPPTAGGSSHCGACSSSNSTVWPLWHHPSSACRRLAARAAIAAGASPAQPRGVRPPSFPPCPRTGRCERFSAAANARIRPSRKLLGLCALPDSLAPCRPDPEPPTPFPISSCRAKGGGAASLAPHIRKDAKGALAGSSGSLPNTGHGRGGACLALLPELIEELVELLIVWP